MAQVEEQGHSPEKRHAIERRAAAFIHLVDDHDNDVTPLHERLYQRVRNLILSGALSHGARLAPSRSLANMLGISRNSVMTALDRLIADGLLESRQGSGVYVRYAGARNVHVPKTKTGTDAPPPFRLGVPPVDVFPAAVWSRLQSRRWQRVSPDLLHGDDPAGWEGLREAIATHVAMTRGIDCSADQVVVTSCTAAGIDLVVRALGLSGHDVWMEDPGYGAATQALQNSGVRVVPVPVDKSGIDVEAGLHLAPRARAAFVTPACQFPIAATMSPARRRALVAWVKERNGWILEDDFDWNNSGMNPPPKPLAAVYPSRTIYFNTFNHLLFPTLRIGYIIAPMALVDRFIAVQRGLNGSSNVPNQMVMADFINGGHLDDHIKRLKTCQEERRAALLQALDTQLSDFLVPLTSNAGSHIVCRTRGLPVNQIVGLAQAENISVPPMANYQLAATGDERVLLGYAGYTPAA
ncbi:MAG TPA: PLP-dependent aminotransferase family protein, partial [Rhizomicrobium sp.]|nr:PLP-dependent aminotransferase family protein [Rhizomicrobium sp.]